MENIMCGVPVIAEWAGVCSGVKKKGLVYKKRNEE